MRSKVSRPFIAIAACLMFVAAGYSAEAAQPAPGARGAAPASPAASPAAGKALPAADSQVIFVPAQQLISDASSAPEIAPHVLVKYYVNTPGYGALTVYRNAPAAAELHKGMMDLWYVVKGSGELVTGGSMVNGHETELGEVRAPSLEGGASRHIAPGDFVVIPANVPHWLRSLDGKEIIYLVVKVTQ